MRVEKKTLNDALRILGKVVCQTSPVELYRSIRFTGDEDGAMAMATDGVEVVSVMLDAFAENEFDFCVPFRELKDLARASRSETLELAGKFIEFPVCEEPTADAEIVELDSNFCEYLAQAAPIINRQEYRKVLQGVNLSRSGITVTDGKQLLNIPCTLDLNAELNIPFPSALLAAKLQTPGVLRTWVSENAKLFQFEIGTVSWYGKATDGNFPAWKSVVPSDTALDYSITFHNPQEVIDWVKMIPGQKTANGVEIHIVEDGAKLISSVQPSFNLTTSAVHIGVQPEVILTLDREILLRMLMQGYNTLRANSKGSMPMMAMGGAGQYIAMPIRTISRPQTQNSIQPEHKEETKMEENNNVVEQPVAPVASPLDELGAAIEELKIKLKAMLDESSVLSRKVKEVALLQKQKERDFIQARRAIERIRMAI